MGCWPSQAYLKVAEGGIEVITNKVINTESLQTIDMTDPIVTETASEAAVASHWFATVSADAVRRSGLGVSLCN